MTGVEKTKRPYRKSTPIGRLRRNADKVSQQVALLRVRLSSWGSSDERVAALEKLAGSVLVRAGELDGLLADLESSGFSPPEKQRSVTWELGQRVAVGGKFRAKYEIAFRVELERDAGYLDDLVVDSILPSGEVAVRRRVRSPHGWGRFLVPKTHLVEAVEASGG
jgi:hypothetical protein